MLAQKLKIKLKETIKIITFVALSKIVLLVN